MNTSLNEIVLRPRFKIDIKRSNTSVLQDFEAQKTIQSNIIINRLEDHVFLKLPKHKTNFWSPQLHLEINEIDKSNCILHGLIGPNPTLWTFFMFLHFIIACLFFAFGIWAYTNWTLKINYAIQVSLMLFMVVIWIALYLGGRVGKSSSKSQMHELNNFMLEVLDKNKIPS